MGFLYFNGDFMAWGKHLFYEDPIISKISVNLDFEYFEN